MKKDNSIRSFFCLDTKERTKEKVKAAEKTAKKFFVQFTPHLAWLKQINLWRLGRHFGQYLFLTLRSEIFHTPFFLNATLRTAAGANSQNLTKPLHYEQKVNKFTSV